MDIGSLADTLSVATDMYQAAAPYIDTVKDAFFGAVEWHQNMMTDYPISANIGQAFLALTFGDLVAQRYAEGSWKAIDWKRARYNALLTPIYGLGIVWLMKSGESVGEIIENFPEFEKSIGSVGKAFLQGALGPNLVGITYNAAMFFNDAVGRETNYSISGLVKAHIDLPKGEKGALRNVWDNYIGRIPPPEFKDATKNGYITWNFIQTANFYLCNTFIGTKNLVTTLVPPIFIWSIYLKWKSNRDSRKTEEAAA